MSKEREYEFCVQVVGAAGDGQAVIFRAPKDWGNMPIEMWPCEQTQVLQLGAKLIRSPAVLVIWRRELSPAPGAGDDDRDPKQQHHS